MKTKEEILKMTKQEIIDYKWSKEIQESFSKNSHCSYCLYCINAIGLKYAIANVEMSKEEYEKKMKELKN